MAHPYGDLPVAGLKPLSDAISILAGCCSLARNLLLIYEQLNGLQ
jgi:hypothetical protein